MKKRIFMLGITTVFRFLIVLLISLSGHYLFGQGEVEKNAMKSIVQYLSVGGSPVTDEILQTIGYTVPKGTILEQEWHSLNADTKIAMAYQAAEKNLPSVGGQRFLALLSQTLAQNYYEAAASEIHLKIYNNTPVVGKVEFAIIGESVNAPSRVNSYPKYVINGIGAIAKYTDAGALGGIRGVLSTHYGMNDEEINEMQSKYKTNLDVLEEAHRRIEGSNSILKLQNVARNLFDQYESSRYDDNLLNLFTKIEIIKIREKWKILDHRQYTNRNKVSTIEYQNSVDEYRKYIESGEKEEQSFEKMKRNRKKFGGVILGNTYTSTIQEKISYVRWIPYYSNNSVANYSTGRLEFVFENSTVLTYHGVYQEDVYAANQIIFGDSIRYSEEEGIGLTGLTYLSYPNGTKRHEIITHPAIKFLKLGWAVTISDAYLECTNDLEESLKNRQLWSSFSDEFYEWKQIMPDGWKITETSLRIESKNKQISVVDSLNGDKLFFSMVGSSDDYKDDISEFKAFLPAVFSISPEFIRLRNFTEVITLFRWIKNQDAKIYGIKTFTFNDFVTPPNCLVVDPEKKLSFFDMKTDQLAIQKAIKTMQDSIINTKYIDKDVLKGVNENIKLRKQIWAKLEKGKIDTTILEKLNLKTACQNLDTYTSVLLDSLNNREIELYIDILLTIDSIKDIDDSVVTEYLNLKSKQNEYITNRDFENFRIIEREIVELEGKYPPLKLLGKFYTSKKLLSEFQKNINEDPVIYLFGLLEYENKIIRYYATKS